MYNIILSLHSWIRWAFLFFLIYAIYVSYTGWKQRKSYDAGADKARFFTLILAHVQLILGVWLYFISPIIIFFTSNFKEAVKQREIRFFGMEHSLMMLIAIILITVGSSIAKRKSNDADKYKTIFIWFMVAFVIIIASIPWSFSMIAPARPLFRGF